MPEVSQMTVFQKKYVVWALLGKLFDFLVIDNRFLCIKVNVFYTFSMFLSYSSAFCVLHVKSVVLCKCWLSRVRCEGYFCVCCADLYFCCKGDWRESQTDDELNQNHWEDLKTLLPLFAQNSFLAVVYGHWYTIFSVCCLGCALVFLPYVFNYKCCFSSERRMCFFFVLTHKR